MIIMFENMEYTLKGKHGKLSRGIRDWINRKLFLVLYLSLRNATGFIKKFKLQPKLQL